MDAAGAVIMVMAAVPVVIGLWRTRSVTKRLREIARLANRIVMRVNMVMSGAVVVMDMHMGVPVTSNRHTVAARQPKDREERSEDSDSQHDGGHPHWGHCTSGSVATTAPPVASLPSEERDQPFPHYVREPTERSREPLQRALGWLGVGGLMAQGSAYEGRDRALLWTSRGR